MAVGFGFSVSDIYMGFKLIKESIHALDEKFGATSDYRILLREIQSLQDGLQAIEELLQGNALSQSQHVALERAVSSCHQSIEDFVDSIAKYQPCLAEFETHGIAPKFRKIRWALCRKDDVKRFRSQLEGHASSISMLLITIQTKQNLNSRALGGPATSNMGEQLPTMVQSMTLEQRQCFVFIMEQNRELLRTVQDLRTILELQNRVPAQILLQQPVVLLDPFGKVAPFHLEFVDSAECFLAVLHTRFAKAGVTRAGLAKLTNSEFSLEDSQRASEINFHRPWSHVFRPGQHIDMRMVYHRFSCRPSTCPLCLATNDENDEEVECQICGLSYQNFQGLSKHSEDWAVHVPTLPGFPIEGNQIPYMLVRPRKPPKLKAFQPPREAESLSLDGFRRVHIVSQPLALLDPLFPALQLIEDFTHFADLVEDMPSELSTSLPNIKRLNQGAKQLLKQSDTDIPAFSSFSQIEQVRKRLTAGSQALREEINAVIKSLSNSPDTADMLDYIKKKPSHVTKSGYYVEALKVMVNLTESANSKKARTLRPISQEKMQWRLLDSGRKGYTL